MELIVDKIFNSIYVENTRISIREKAFAILIGISPFLVVVLWFISE